jgi:hypothetical protein
MFGVLLFGAVSSAASIELRPAGMYWSHSFKDGASPESKTTITHYDFIGSLGYKWDTGLYIGGTYFWSQEETQQDSGGSSVDTKDTHTAYGPTIGYLGQNLYVLGTYHLSPVYVTGTDSSKTTYEGGYGYEIDFGYMFWINSSFGLGPQLTYYHADFKKKKDAGGVETDLPNTASESDLRPIVALSFLF